MPGRGWLTTLVAVFVVAGSATRGACAPWEPPGALEGKPLGLSGQGGARHGSGPAIEIPARDAEQRSASGEHWLATVGVLGGVIALVVAGAWGLRTLSRRGTGGLLASLGPGGRAPSGVMEVLGRYPIGRGATLVLLKLDRRILLLCQNVSRAGGGAMTTLAEIRDPEEVASILLKTRDEEGESLARRFEGLLAGESRAFDEPVRQPLAGPVRTGDAARRVRGRLAALRGRNGTEVRA